MATRYDTEQLTEAQFEHGSRGRVLKNFIGIRSKRVMDEMEATKLVEEPTGRSGTLPPTSASLLTIFVIGTSSGWERCIRGLASIAR